MFIKHLHNCGEKKGRSLLTMKDKQTESFRKWIRKSGKLKKRKEKKMLSVVNRRREKHYPTLKSSPCQSFQIASGV